MQSAILYGIGVGPGDPELITVKGASILARCRHVFVPTSRTEKGSNALTIAQTYVQPDCHIYELVFPMTKNEAELARHWDESAQRMASVIQGGKDACFLTLGDPLLYSTYIYVLRSLRRQFRDIKVITIPGITAFSAAAAMAEFAVGTAEESVCIVPTIDDLTVVREALDGYDTVVLMKIGKRLVNVLDLLEELDLLDYGVFVSRVGMEGERIEFNLRELRQEAYDASYFSLLLVHAGNKRTLKYKGQ